MPKGKAIFLEYHSNEEKFYLIYTTQFNFGNGDSVVKKLSLWKLNSAYLRDQIPDKLTKVKWKLELLFIINNLSRNWLY